MLLATCLTTITALYESQDISDSQVTGSVRTTEFHFTKWDTIVYA
jgi:hypothetical protein